MAHGQPFAPEQPAPLEQVEHPLLRHAGVTLLVSREDLRDPHISGNKWHKLRFNLDVAEQQGVKRIISFGGAYSNHLHALARCGQQRNLATIGFVRGEPVQPLNPTLQDCVDWGMQLLPLSRSDYQRRHEPEFVAELSKPFPDSWVIPEGGANAEGLRGCMALGESLAAQAEFDYLCVPCGSGTTLAGIAASVGRGTQVLGFVVLKVNEQQDFVQRVQSLQQLCKPANPGEWRLLHDFHCGGFAKIDTELVRFMREWQQHSSIPIEPLYSAKMLLGIFHMLARGEFQRGTRILALHTGGLQGMRGMRAKLEQAIKNLEP